MAVNCGSHPYGPPVWKGWEARQPWGCFLCRLSRKESSTSLLRKEALAAVLSEPPEIHRPRNNPVPGSCQSGSESVSTRHSRHSARGPV